MGILIILAFLFAMGSILGWTLEVFFRRIVSQKKWMNPGFLVGPYLPLYGFSLCILYLLARLEPHLNAYNNIILQKALLFMLMASFITLVEYVAGIIFIKGMKIKLWDYSNEWGNYKGIICPKYSMFWFILSAIYYFLIDPYILQSLVWLSKNLTFCFVIGFFFGVFVIDLVYSSNIIAKIREAAIENKAILNIEKLKSDILANKQKRKEKHKFLLALHSETPLQEQLKIYFKNNFNAKDTKNKKLKK